MKPTETQSVSSKSLVPSVNSHFRGLPVEETELRTNKGTFRAKKQRYTHAQCSCEAQDVNRGMMPKKVR